MVQPIIAGLVTCRPSNSWQRNFRRRGVPTATWAVPQWRGGREKWWDGVAWVRLDHVVDYIHAYRSQMLHIWNIYLQNWVIFGVNVGKYSSTMEHLGDDLLRRFGSSPRSWSSLPRSTLFEKRAMRDDPFDSRRGSGCISPNWFGDKVIL